MKLIIAAVCWLVLSASPALAAPEDVANRISNEIMSPYCPGVTLHDCPSRQADELREQIKEWAARGWDDELIMDELVEQYGEGIRATPPSEGGGILWWILPGIVALLGALLAARLARRWAGARDRDRGKEALAVQQEGRSLSADQKQRLKAELADHEARMMGIEPRGGG